MPELPEVETIKRVLEPQIKGRTIISASVRRPEVTAYPKAEEFTRRLQGRTILGMQRRGKFLIILFTDGGRMALHLRMTGCLLLTPCGYPEEKHTHIVFRLDQDKELRFSDTRRFGRFWLFEKGEEDLFSGISKLGLEPFDPGLTAEYLFDHFGKRKKAIKECLLEQTTVAGIGNIYADEILFTAGIYPARPANHFEQEEWERLAAVIPKRLSYFIEKNKITPEEYLEGKGRDYRNTPFLQVYGKKDGACPVCGSVLCRMIVGGRGSVYCPECQRNER